jgi:hypothetical protein
VLQVPYLVSLGLVAAILILREWQNQRTIKELLNRLLIKHGVDPIPDEHPLAGAIKELMPEREPWPPKELGATKKQQRERIAVRIPVPGMDILRHMMTKRKAS